MRVPVCLLLCVRRPCAAALRCFALRMHSTALHFCRSGQDNDTLGQSFTMMKYHIHMHSDPVPPSQGLYPPMDPGWAPDPLMANPAIHTPDNKLAWPELWTRRRS